MNRKGEKIVAIIVARGGSKSIPRKNVLPLHGKPLIGWPIDLAKSVEKIDRVIVSTDDDEIADIAQKYGAEVPFKRPADLAMDDTPTLPVIRHCVEYLEKEENYHPSIVLVFFPTAPFLKKERVEQALEKFESTTCNSVISVVEDWGRFWLRDEQKAIYTMLHPKERVNRQYYSPLYREDGAIYFSRRDVWMEQNRAVDDENIEFVIHNADENIDIDNPSDWVKAITREPEEK
ncbi:MAG: acylneuraminate cytidylyltransferase family protein [Candidatus Pacebacteria bacterium]|nr:acylneuraminate cytidylyltransferase family protein [Candidatus Paceibacterota bacterium]MBP9842569.1 acylneuraminate cytidylyltransferase family protein [Candidatus Paceibacterota bacterium]